MTSGGRRVDDQLLLLRLTMQVRNLALEDALDAAVEPELRDAVKQRWEAEQDQPIQRIRGLVGPSAPSNWFLDYRTEEGYIWSRLRLQLIKLNRSEADVDSVDRASDRVLRHLEDPREGGPTEFGVHGLVLGYIQAGKTENMTALIAKAVDLGYKLIIVLSGLDNSLRLQTQQRLDRDLGLRDHPAGIGVPTESAEQWFPLTSADLHGDFRLGSFDPSAVVHKSGRALAVSKKNADVLRRLIGFLETAKVQDLPLLLVDDEADHASINTGGDRPDEEDEIDGPQDDRDPSTINALIRTILAMFRRKAYVAYTATPFANVLIDPERV